MKTYPNYCSINLTKFLVGLLLIVAFFSQCTIQKRVHQKGWYVSFRQPIRSLTTDSKTQQKSELVEVDSIHTTSPASPELVRQTSVPLLFQDSIAEPYIEMIPLAESHQRMLLVVSDTVKRGGQHQQQSEPEKESKGKKHQVIKTIVIAAFVLLMLTIFIAGAISITATATAIEIFGYAFFSFLMLLLIFFIAVSESKRKEQQAKREAEAAEKKEQKNKEIKRAPTQEELLELQLGQKRRAIVLTVFLSVLLGITLLIVFPIFPYVEISFLIFVCVMYVLLLIATWSFKWRKAKPIEISVVVESEVIPEPDKPVLSENELRKKKRKKSIVGVVFLVAVLTIGLLMGLG